MNDKVKKLIVLLTSTVLLSSCAHKEYGPPSTINGFPAGDSKTSTMRLSALQETATSLGAQSALAWTSKQINQSLERDDRHLNQVFNFRALLLNDNVLPPVLVEGEKALDIDNPETLRLADKIYKIEAPPRFVTAAPIWRDYLWMNYTTPERPPASFLPRDNEERGVWNTYVLQGWKEGVEQANQIFSANMGRLKRDYNGMITYKILLAQKMVTPPYVAKTNLGVTGDENQLRINDRILRITATSKLIPDSKRWAPVMRPGTVGAIRKQGTEGTEELE